MNTAEVILVIFLSSFLTIFLILSIMAVYRINQLVQYLTRITEKAEKVADNVEHASEFFAKTAGPIAIGRLLSNIAENVWQHNKKKGK